ncbi:MAG TPA: hypothetical protein VGF55_06415 [Gemmataceae bacterium]|jgi:hypothetical protein
MHIPDMQVLDSGRVAVGWLHRDHPFPHGEVSPEFIVHLKELARRHYASADALDWGATGGCHTCELCDKVLGFGSFGVPAGDRLFYAPDMIAHYVEQHRYAPLAEFVAAVLACPLPGTPEYANAVRPFTEQVAD